MDGNVNLKEENCRSFLAKSSLVAGLKGENSGGFSPEIGGDSYPKGENYRSFSAKSSPVVV